MSSSKGNLDASIFVNKLKTILRFETLYANFNEILKSHKALIAGGCVLSAYAGFDINDIDIYVHQSYASSMFSKLNSLGFNLESSNVAPSYDASFLKKNNIQTRLNLRLLHENSGRIEIDLMIIPSHIPLVNVILNFDLSFCKIWYNGTYVYANNLIEIERKEGYLGKDYVHKLFTELNTFTWFRLKKYIKRGFKIQFEELYNSKNVGNLVNQKNTTLLNTDAIKEEWFVKYIIRNLFKLGIFKKMQDNYTECIINKGGYSVIEYVSSIYKDNPKMYFYNHNKIAYLACNMKDFTVESLKTAFKLSNILELINKTKKNVSFKGILLYIILKKYNNSVTPYDSIKNNVEYKEIVLKYLDIPENILNMLSNYDNDELLSYGSSIKLIKIVEKLSKLNIKYANIKQSIDSKLENRRPVGNATNAARQLKEQRDINKLVKEAGKLNKEIIATDKKFKNYLNKDSNKLEFKINSAPTGPLPPPPSLPPSPKKAFSSPRNKKRMLAKIPNKPKKDNSVILNSNDTPEIDLFSLDSIKRDNYVYLQGKYYNREILREWLLFNIINTSSIIKIPHNNLPLKYDEAKMILYPDEMKTMEDIIRNRTSDEAIVQNITPPHIKRERAKEIAAKEREGLYSSTTSSINGTPPSWLPPRRNTAAPAGPAGPAGP